MIWKLSRKKLKMILLIAKNVVILQTVLQSLVRRPQNHVKSRFDPGVEGLRKLIYIASNL